jgi:hypothetical protein
MTDRREFLALLAGLGALPNPGPGHRGRLERVEIGHRIPR